MQIQIKNKLLVEQSVLIWSTRNFNLLNAIYHIDCIHHQQKKHKNIIIEGIEEFKKYMEDFLKQYPDYQERIIDQIAEDDKVVSMLECKASNIVWSGVILDKIHNNKIIETRAWFKRDILFQKVL